VMVLKAILPLLPGKAALAGSNLATAATLHAPNTAKATEATNNTVLLLGKRFVALKKPLGAIFSPQLSGTGPKGEPQPCITQSPRAPPYRGPAARRDAPGSRTASPGDRPISRGSSS
jgi:hypothetical protein